MATISWVLSEGDKRDSKSNMPESEGVIFLFSRSSKLHVLLIAAAEATLLRSQRLGLGRGEPIPTLTSVLPLFTRVGLYGDVVKRPPRGRGEKIGEEEKVLLFNILGCSTRTWGWAGRVSL